MGSGRTSDCCHSEGPAQRRGMWIGWLWASTSDLKQIPETPTGLIQKDSTKLLLLSSDVQYEV